MISVYLYRLEILVCVLLFSGRLICLLGCWDSIVWNEISPNYICLLTLNGRGQWYTIFSVVGVTVHIEFKALLPTQDEYWVMFKLKTLITLERCTSIVEWWWKTPCPKIFFSKTNYSMQYTFFWETNLLIRYAFKFLSGGVFSLGVNLLTRHSLANDGIVFFSLTLL